MWRLFVLPLVFGLLSGKVSAADSLIIYTEQFPPYNFRDNREIRGINVDLVAETCVKSDLLCHFQLLPWSRAMSNTLATDNSGLISTSRLPAREDQFAWVGPLVSSRACLYKLKERSDITVSDKASLLNYTIGVTRDDVYEKILLRWGFEEGKNYLAYSRKFEEIRMFKLKKQDLIFASPLVMERQFAKYDIAIDDVIPVLEVKDEALKGNYLALNKAVSAAVINKMQRVLDSLKNTNFVSKTIANYETFRIQEPSDNDGPNPCLNSAFRY
ncbi:MAG: substrate-binding periplasmic protein [Aestuariibacter sp.]